MKNRDSKRWRSFIHDCRTYGVAYLFMLPWMIGFAVLMLFPLLWSFFMSFNQVSVTKDGFKFVWIGLDNFHNAIFSDNEFPIQLILFYQEMLLMIPIILIFSFIVSILLNQKFPGRTIFRAIFFLPVIFSTGQVLNELFAQGAGQLPFIQQYNIEPLIKEYVSSQFAGPIIDILSKIVIILWYSGVQILIFIAGFQTIPKTIYEAVRIDGASPWESFWKITLPAMIPFISLNALFTIVDLATMPLNPVLEQIQTNMFRPDRGYGYASAIAWLYFALILILLAIVLWFTNRNRPGRR